MENEEKILAMLQEIRADQLRAMEMQKESFERQRKAIARSKIALWIAFPLVAICLLLWVLELAFGH
ncbi:MAG: hypothetical protein ABSD28_06745 [Tepidisphaeraceae bacterium]|jgi:hypothetical protein